MRRVCGCGKFASDGIVEVIKSGQAQLGQLTRMGRTMVLSNKVPVKVGERDNLVRSKLWRM